MLKIRQFIQRIFGFCDTCGRWLVFPKRRRRNTAYHDDEQNYVTLCWNCFLWQEERWDEMWREYHSGLL